MHVVCVCGGGGGGCVFVFVCVTERAAEMADIDNMFDYVTGTFTIASKSLFLKQ